MGGWSTNQMRNFCFQEGFRGGFHSLSDVELALACCSKMWGCNMPRQRTISLRRLNARWKWFREPRTHGNRIPLQIFSRKCHFWDLTVFFLCGICQDKLYEDDSFDSSNNLLDDESHRFFFEKSLGWLDSSVLKSQELKGWQDRWRSFKPFKPLSVC